jgi:hypothetical protein
MTESNWNFTVYEASLYRLAREHRLDVADEAGGSTWYCSCGRHGDKGGSYPTRAQATARGHRHLRAAQRRIQREIEAAIDLGGCGDVWTDPVGVTHTCAEHRGDLYYVHSDGDKVIWNNDGRYQDDERGVVG